MTPDRRQGEGYEYEVHAGVASGDVQKLLNERGARGWRLLPETYKRTTHPPKGVYPGGVTTTIVSFVMEFKP